jgi:internalin A
MHGTVLDLTGLGLSTLPPEICQLTSLTRLWLLRNKLETLPPEIGQLTTLQEFSAAHNRLRDLPDIFGALRELRKLWLDHNQINELPESIGELRKLEELWLYRNQLSKLPESFGGLTNLVRLDLRNNRLEQLPNSFGDLQSLVFLWLWDNRLQTLPDTASGLTSLKELHLENNKLTDLPLSLLDPKELRRLFLHGNEHLQLPREILGPTRDEVGRGGVRFKPAKEILDYYFAARGAEGMALREMKLIVVGRGGVGKTSIIKRLMGESFDPYERETHGINIRELELRCTDGPVQARVWDFGGQQVLHAMHEFFLTARSLYLLVLSERDDMADRDAAYWLQLIRSYAGLVPVVVALNKSGGRAGDIGRSTLGQGLAWVPTECSEADPGKSGIDDLRAALTKAADGMEEVRRRFPAKWFEIKKWLRDMKDPYIDYGTYAARCAELGEPNPGKQEDLAAWLHDLGVALNYGRDPRLRDTTVLRPDWLANGIYAILRANDARHEKPLAPDGIVTPESLGQIYSAAEKLEMLKDTDYPEEKWPFVLRLMSLFQLSFPLDEGGQRQLVPGLLPVEEPSAATEPDGAGRVRLRYEFNVVPAPLVPRLLVRTFGLIENALHWRRGALLRYGPATAKIWATPDQRWVYATISGPREARDDLMMMLRETLRILFAEYKNLSVVEQMDWDGAWVPLATLEKMGIITADAIAEVAELKTTEEETRT